MFGNHYKPKCACRIRFSKHPKFWTEPLLNSRKKPYFEVKIFRNNFQISKIILEDTGFTKFTIIDLGTFLIPDENDKKLYLRSGRKTYLNYDISSIKPFQPVSDLKPMGFKMPAISPREYVDLLETQAMADVCAEDVKDVNWLLWFAIAGVALLVMFLFWG